MCAGRACKYVSRAFVRACLRACVSTWVPCARACASLLANRMRGKATPSHCDAQNSPSRTCCPTFVLATPTHQNQRPVSSARAPTLKIEGHPRQTRASVKGEARQYRGGSAWAALSVVSPRHSVFAVSPHRLISLPDDTAARSGPSEIKPWRTSRWTISSAERFHFSGPPRWRPRCHWQS